MMALSDYHQVAYSFWYQFQYWYRYVPEKMSSYIRFEKENGTDASLVLIMQSVNSPQQQ